MNELERKFKRLKREVDQLDREITRKEGSYETLLKQLQDDYDCDSLEEAQEYLKKLERDEKKLERQLAKKMDAFEEKWGDQLYEED